MIKILTFPIFQVTDIICFYTYIRHYERIEFRLFAENNFSDEKGRHLQSNEDIISFRRRIKYTGRPSEKKRRNLFSQQKRIEAGRGAGDFLSAVMGGDSDTQNGWITA